MNKKYSKGPPADPVIVRQLTTCLLEAFNGFMDSFEGDITYIEGMMAAHNFHVRAIEHLVEETGEEIWRQMARDTFTRRMDNPGAYDTKRGLE